MDRETLLEWGISEEQAERVLETAQALEQEWRGKADALEEGLRQMEEGHTEELARVRLENTVELELLRAGARDPRTVRPLLDLSGGTAGELAEQIGRVRAQAGWLFEEPSAAVDSGAHHGAPGKDAPQTLGGALSAYYR